MWLTFCTAGSWLHYIFRALEIRLAVSVSSEPHYTPASPSDPAVTPARQTLVLHLHPLPPGVTVALSKLRATACQSDWIHTAHLNGSFHSNPAWAHHLISNWVKVYFWRSLDILNKERHVASSAIRFQFKNAGKVKMSSRWERCLLSSRKWDKYMIF